MPSYVENIIKDKNSKQTTVTNSEKINPIKEISDIFSIDIKCGLGFNVSFLSELGVDLYSQQAEFSTDGYKEETTSGVSLGIVNIQKTCEGGKSSTLLDSGKIEIDIGPFQMNGNDKKVDLDATYSFGLQAIIGINVNISGKEIVDLFKKWSNYEN